MLFLGLHACAFTLRVDSLALFFDLNFRPFAFVLSRFCAPCFSRTYSLFFALILSRSCVNIYILSKERIARTGQSEQDNQNRTAGTGQDRQNRTSREGQAEQDRQSRTGIAG